MSARALRSASSAACCAAIRDMDQRETMRSIANPVLVIAGRQDQSTPPARGKAIADAIAGAQFLQLEAGHLSNIEAEEAFTKAVVEFLTVKEAAAKAVPSKPSPPAPKAPDPLKPEARKTAKKPARKAAAKKAAKKANTKAASKKAAKSAKKPASKATRKPAKAAAKKRPASKAARKPAKKAAKKSKSRSKSRGKR